MSDTDALLDVLLAGGRRADRLTHVEHLPARAGIQVDWPSWADTSVVSGYRALGVDRPWRHQVEAADAAWSGHHTVIATSTGSGKSLAFWLPALTAVRADIGAGTLDPGRIESVQRRGSVLYLCPTKALAADQLDLVGAPGHRRFNQLRGFRGKLAAADHQRDSAVLQLRAQVEVHFGVQAGTGSASRAAAAQPAKAGQCAHMLGAHFMNFDAHAQQLPAIAGVTHMGGRRVIGSQGIGQHADAHAFLADGSKLRHHALAGHKVRRDDQQIAFGVAHQLQQAIDRGTVTGHEQIDAFGAQ